MSDDRDTDDAVVRWLDLVLPRPSLQRRVRRNAHLDALRGVQDAGRHPATIDEIAAWEASTIRALGGHVRKLVGPRNARVDNLRVRIAALGPSPSQRLVTAPPAAAGGADVTQVGASHPEAQARRRARLDAQQWAVVDADRAALQAELAHEEAMRVAVVDEVRETARQCHESSLALQHLYWAVRTRWARRRHGAPPAPALADVQLPEWVTAPEVLYGGRQ
jgi:hypothetical protein